MVEIGENGILRKKTSNLFHGIKNRRFGVDFAEKSKFEVKTKFRA